MSRTSAWHILVVEDEPDGQMFVTRLLKNFNITTDAVATGEDALAALQTRPYTAAIVDLALPGMDGMQVVQNIKENPDTANLPCIAMTAYHTSKVKEQALEAGFDAYFSKPLDDTTFVREIERILSN